MTQELEAIAKLNSAKNRCPIALPH